MTASVGILAYGSLIDDPGSKIKSAIVNRISCRTPFKVEYARSSKNRCGAPTLVPCDNGAQVNAKILVVDLPLSEAQNLLYDRETYGKGKTYSPPKHSTSNSVVIKTLCNFEEIDKVIYTSIRANIKELTPEKLASLAIYSARRRADGRDGISYLMNAKKAGIRTPLSEPYEAEILKSTETTTLEDALQRCRELGRC